ncbi:MAG: 8-oxo-dGTP pyrophosphatase MutT (NUDIX family)/phosphohistidine phosphatase SixA [Aquiluna sp.]|jgi:8-oxo-dGTP pyrophosphatase MutT (NUDIX family)/phosphohistidine phosphatase SixA
MTVYAAGAVCWRMSKGEIELAIVFRTKHKDWTFPKGKVDPGELLPETAVREVEEEAGIRIRLGRKLAVIDYELDSGETKEVHYWVSKVKDSAIAKSKFTANDEIEKVEWFTAKKAMKQLTYDHDRELLAKTLEFYDQGELETRGLVILRHTSATPRASWAGEEAKRPLLPEGRQQAKRLVSLLDAYGPKRLVTSPWTRCQQTVAPYSKKTKRTLIERSQLTELANERGPRKTKNVIEDTFGQTKNALICSHRPALPTILETFSKYASKEITPALTAEKTLAPGEFFVLRVTTGPKPKIIAYERVYLESALSEAKLSA